MDGQVRPLATCRTSTPDGQAAAVRRGGCWGGGSYCKRGPPRISTEGHSSNWRMCGETKLRGGKGRLRSDKNQLLEREGRHRRSVRYNESEGSH